MRQTILSSMQLLIDWYIILHLTAVALETPCYNECDVDPIVDSNANQRMRYSRSTQFTFTFKNATNEGCIVYDVACLPTANLMTTSGYQTIIIRSIAAQLRCIVGTKEDTDYCLPLRHINDDGSDICIEIDTLYCLSLF
jgi:hypothetical protein